MTANAPAIVAAARGCVGTRFRPQGRVPGLGLDCVGVVAVAAAAAGATVDLPAYLLSGEQCEAVANGLAAHGCRRVWPPAPGDILVLAPSSRHRHLGIVTSIEPGTAIVHAHAGLRRVVEGPVDPAWHIIGAWRLAEG